MWYLSQVVLTLFRFVEDFGLEGSPKLRTPNDLLVTYPWKGPGSGSCVPPSHRGIAGAAAAFEGGWPGRS